MKKLIETFYQATLENKGCSKTLEGVSPSEGFMVANAGTEVVVDLKDFNKSTVEKFISENLKALQANNNVCVGSWIDNNKVYLDISENILVKEVAVATGKKNNQLAIFDLSTFESIYL